MGDTRKLNMRMKDAEDDKGQAVGRKRGDSSNSSGVAQKDR